MKTTSTILTTTSLIALLTSFGLMACGGSEVEPADQTQSQAQSHQVQSQGQAQAQSQALPDVVRRLSWLLFVLMLIVATHR